MKITSKVILGYLLMVLIIIAVHLYQSSLMQEMLDQQRQIAEVGFGTALKAHRIFIDLRDLDEFSTKYVASGDRPYLDRALGLRERISEQIPDLLRANLFLGPMGELTRRVVERWTECSSVIIQMDRGLQLEYSEARDSIHPSCVAVYDSLQALMQAGDVYRAQVSAQTRETGTRLTSVSRWALPIALALAAGVTLLVYRSISHSLKEMMEGVRRIAGGDFEVKIGAGRGDELSELAVVLNRMTRRLRELDRLKRDFISHVSHDLRAPLASIEETTQLLLEEFSGALDETQKRLLTLNLASSRRLARLIGNLLDLSRIDAGVITYDFKEIEVSRVAEECVESLHGLYLDKQLEVSFSSSDDRCRVRADRARIGRVLENLLANAVEFSPAGGTIRVAVELGSRSSDGTEPFEAFPGGPLCRISVADEGPGIPFPERDRIFDQFYTSSGIQESYRRGGTGLGLTIAKKIVEAHDGEIWVEENPTGRGSRFNILLRAVHVGNRTGVPA